MMFFLKTSWMSGGGRNELTGTTASGVQCCDVDRMLGTGRRWGETEVEMTARQAGEKSSEKAAGFGGQPVSVIEESERKLICASEAVRLMTARLRTIIAIGTRNNWRELTQE